MVEAVMLWNEPNNLSHWDFKVDPDWKIFSRMTIAAETPHRNRMPAMEWSADDAGQERFPMLQPAPATKPCFVPGLPRPGPWAAVRAMLPVAGCPAAAPVPVSDWHLPNRPPRRG